jgi:hypothetical protein
LPPVPLRSLLSSRSTLRQSSEFGRTIEKMRPVVRCGNRHSVGLLDYQNIRTRGRRGLRLKYSRRACGQRQIRDRGERRRDSKRSRCPTPPITPSQPRPSCALSNQLQKAKAAGDDETAAAIQAAIRRALSIIRR